MPEGPEIRRAADQIAEVLVGRSLERVFFAKDTFPELARRADELVGQRVLRVDTHGKAMLTRLEGGRTLYSHNQLYGRWYVCDRDRLPRTDRSLRLGLHTANHSALLYSASEIELLGAGDLASHPFLSKLGPDILDKNLSWQMLRDRALSPRFARRSLAALYLDQSYIAGVGNYLRSEILFAARVCPWSKPGDLTGQELRKLGQQTRLIGQRAYTTGGITNPTRLVARIKAQLRADFKTCRSGPGSVPPADRYPWHDKEAFRFAVFRRDGAPCYVCGTAIERTNAGARRLYFCPRCQAAGSHDPGS